MRLDLYMEKNQSYSHMKQQWEVWHIILHNKREKFPADECKLWSVSLIRERKLKGKQERNEAYANTRVGNNSELCKNLI